MFSRICGKAGCGKPFRWTILSGEFSCHCFMVDVSTGIPSIGLQEDYTLLEDLGRQIERHEFGRVRARLKEIEGGRLRRISYIYNKKGQTLSDQIFSENPKELMVLLHERTELLGSFIFCKAMGKKWSELEVLRQSGHLTHSEMRAFFQRFKLILPAEQIELARNLKAIGLLEELDWADYFPHLILLNGQFVRKPAGVNTPQESARSLDDFAQGRSMGLFERVLLPRIEVNISAEQSSASYQVQFPSSLAAQSILESPDTAGLAAAAPPSSYLEGDEKKYLNLIEDLGKGYPDIRELFFFQASQEKQWALLKKIVNHDKFWFTREVKLRGLIQLMGLPLPERLDIIKGLIDSDLLDSLDMPFRDIMFSNGLLIGQPLSSSASALARFPPLFLSYNNPALAKKVISDFGGCDERQKIDFFFSLIYKKSWVGVEVLMKPPHSFLTPERLAKVLEQFREACVETQLDMVKNIMRLGLCNVFYLLSFLNKVSLFSDNTFGPKVNLSASIMPPPINAVSADPSVQKGAPFAFTWLIENIRKNPSLLHNHFLFNWIEEEKWDCIRHLRRVGVQVELTEEEKGRLNHTLSTYDAPKQIRLMEGLKNVGLYSLLEVKKVKKWLASLHADALPAPVPKVNKQGETALEKQERQKAEAAANRSKTIKKGPLSQKEKEFEAKRVKRAAEEKAMTKAKAQREAVAVREEQEAAAEFALQQKLFEEEEAKKSASEKVVAPLAVRNAADLALQRLESLARETWMAISTGWEAQLAALAERNREARERLAPLREAAQQKRYAKEWTDLFPPVPPPMLIAPLELEARADIHPSSLASGLSQEEEDRYTLKFSQQVRYLERLVNPNRSASLTRSPSSVVPGVVLAPAFGGVPTRNPLFLRETVAPTQPELKYAYSKELKCIAYFLKDLVLQHQLEVTVYGSAVLYSILTILNIDHNQMPNDVDLFILYTKEVSSILDRFKFVYQKHESSEGYYHRYKGMIAGVPIDITVIFPDYRSLDPVLMTRLRFKITGYLEFQWRLAKADGSGFEDELVLIKLLERLAQRHFDIEHPQVQFRPTSFFCRVIKYLNRWREIVPDFNPMQQGTLCDFLEVKWQRQYFSDLFQQRSNSISPAYLEIVDMVLKNEVERQNPFIKQLSQKILHAFFMALLQPNPKIFDELLSNFIAFTALPQFWRLLDENPRGLFSLSKESVIYAINVVYEYIVRRAQPPPYYAVLDWKLEDLLSQGPPLSVSLQPLPGYSAATALGPPPRRSSPQGSRL